SMSYTPNGLFNHTAAIYQMLTGYPPDKVSPSGQLEPPSPADFPTAGSQVSKLKPPTDPVLPFVELPRPLQESGIIGKGGSAGFLGKAYDPYRMYQDPAKPVKLEDLSLRKDIPPERLKDRFELLKGVNESMPDLQKALNDYAVDEYYGKAYDLVLSGKARDAMDQRGMLKETLVVAVGEFGRSPRLGVSTSGNSNSPDGRDHWPYCYSAVVAGAGIARGAQYGESDATASSPKEKPVHPGDLL